MMRPVDALHPVVRPAVSAMCFYLANSPVSRGKGFLSRSVLRPLLPAPPSGFRVVLPGGGTVFLHFRETLGLSMLISGSLEEAELRCLRAWAVAGTVAIDVGANIGLFTVPLALAVGSDGLVMAVEPLPSNVRRLRDAVHVNGLENVRIYQTAGGNSDGETRLHLSDDPAYPSTVRVLQEHGIGRAITVPVRRLDTLWNELSRPRVSVVKVDTEGAELMVLKGSEDLLARCRPVILAEAATPAAYHNLQRWLGVREYVEETPGTFLPWNHLFVPR